MKTVLLVGLVALLWGGADLLRKIVTPGSSYQLLSFFFNLGVFLSPLFILLWFVFKKHGLKYNSLNLGISLLAGLAGGLGGVLVFYLFSK